MLKKTLIVLLVLVFLLAALVSVVLFNRKALRWAINTVAVPASKGVLRSFDFDRYLIRFPNQITFTGGEMVLATPAGKQKLVWNDLILTARAPLWAKKKNLEVELRGGTFEIPPATVSYANGKFKVQLSGGWIQIKGKLTASQVSVEKPPVLAKAVTVDVEEMLFEKGKLSTLTGSALADNAVYDAYQVQNVGCLLVGDSQSIWFGGLRGQLYSGAFAGQILLEYAPRITYSIQLDLKDVALKELRSANKDLFAQVSGKAGGWVNLGGDQQGLTKIEGDLQMPEGGNIRAVWLSPLLSSLQGIKNSVQYKDLESRINADGPMPVDHATLRLRTITQHKLGVEVDILTETNLAPNLLVDINLDGGLGELLRNTHFLPN